MADAAEQAFVSAFVKTLASMPIAFPDDYQQLPEHTPKRVPVVPVSLPPPTERPIQVSSTSELSSSIHIAIKSLKPAKSFGLTVSLTDPISGIKAQLAAQSGAPPVECQRLLLRGKALADGKLLKEYDVKNGDTINLMVKPGHDWHTVAAPAPVAAATQEKEQVTSVGIVFPKKASSASSPSKTSSRTPSPLPELTTRIKVHSRTPSIVLSPSPSTNTSPLMKAGDISIVLDPSDAAMSGGSPVARQTSYHTTLANPTFWARLREFLMTEFASESDALYAFEEYLRASKATLTANEIAKIRDEVGIIGMAGT